MNFNREQLLYWLSPIIGAILQLVILIVVSFNSARRDPDASFALFASFILITLLDIGIIIISYIFLWTITSLKKHSKLTLVIMLITFLLIWTFVGFAAEIYRTSIVYIVSYIIWVMLYLTPILLAIKLYVFKNM